MSRQWFCRPGTTTHPDNHLPICYEFAGLRSYFTTSEIWRITRFDQYALPGSFSLTNLWEKQRLFEVASRLCPQVTVAWMYLGFSLLSTEVRWLSTSLGGRKSTYFSPSHAPACD